MSNRPNRLLWEAKPHTIAKINLLKNYLNAWYPIVGKSFHGRGVCFIDGFAGPGEYTNFSEGSPIAALIVARAWLSKFGKTWAAGNLRFIFIDEDKDRIEHLRELALPFTADPKFEIAFYSSSFETGIKMAEEEHPAWLAGNGPTFLFVDPFGTKGVPFNLIYKLLKRDHFELLLNFDADGAARIHLAGNNADASRILTELFGDEDWRNVVSENPKIGALCPALMQHYRVKLRTIPGLQYTFPFEMRSKANLSEYFLLFGSKHVLGLEKMKEAMKSIDQAGDYSFSGANVDQTRLFRFDDHSSWAKTLHRTFLGRNMSWAEIRDFVLTETPFVNAKKMLSLLEKKGAVKVTSSDSKRRIGTYKHEKLITDLEFIARNE